MLTVKPIEDFPKYYVADNGSVFSTKRGELNELIPHDNNNGYNQVKLSIKGGDVSRKVHRLVAQAFIDNPENLPVVNHLNGDKKDNRVSNLEWTTVQGNIRHAVRTKEWWGPSGTDHHFTRVTVEMVKAVNVQLENGISQRKIAAMHGVSQRTILNIKKSDTWIQRRNDELTDEA